MKATRFGRVALTRGTLAACAGILLNFLATTQVSAAQGEDWLAAQAQPDGAIVTPTGLATPFQATAEALRALHASGVGDRPEALAAQQYLAAESYHNTETLSRKIIVATLIGADASVLVQELIGSQESTGGFGELADYAATPLDTAFALEALALTEGSPEAIQKAVGYLLSTQAQDGSWHAGRNEPSIYVTALAVRALGQLKGRYSLETSLATAQRFLLGQVHADGSWGGSFNTALVLLGLTPHISDISLLAASVEALRNRQAADGSWDGSVFATSLALRALTAYTTRESAAFGVGTGAVSGQVVSADGGEPLGGARVELATGLSAETGADGRFLLAGAPSGTHTLLVTRLGYAGYSAVANVSSGAVTDMGQIALPAVADTGIVLGRVVDGISGTVIDSVRVSLAGASIGEVLSDARGDFEFAGVSPGEYQLRFEKQGYHAAALPVTIGAGQAYNVTQALVQEGAYLDDAPADLTGRVLDGNTGEPLPGAAFSLAAGDTAQTDATGRFILADVERGTHSAELTASGYAAQTYQFSFEPGMRGELGDFSVYPAPARSVPTSLTLYGRVLNGVDNVPVAGASITLLSDGSTVSADAEGRFTLADLSQTEFAIEISASGYVARTYTISVSAYGEAAADFALSPLSQEPDATSTRIEGQVLDASTNEPIPGATISIVSLALSTTTDAAGSYALSDIGELAFTVGMAAPGYQARSYVVELQGHGTYRIDGAMQPLDPAEPPRVQILSLVPVVGRAGVDAALLFEAQLANLTDAPLEVLLAGSAFDGGGEAAGETRTFAPDSETPEAHFAFAPHETKTVRVAWDTAQHAPDAYRVMLRAVGPGSISRDQPNGRVLAETAAYGVVEAQSRFVGELIFDPPLTQAGAQTPVKLSALVLNTGNVPIATGAYTITVYDESGSAPLHTASATVADLPVANHRIADFGEWLPTAEGNLPVVLRAADPALEGEVLASMYVGDKASGSFTVDRQIVPEGTQQVSARIDMQGVDTSRGTGTDPLTFAVKEAVRKGGEFVASESLKWHRTSRCLGCHIQTQSLVGLASSFEKAPIDESAAKFLYNTIASSQQADGGLRISHPQYTRTQTGLAGWALTAWPNREEAFRTKYRAAKHMYDRRSQSGNRTWWSPDHSSGWWRSADAQTATVVMAYADLLRGAEEIDLAQVEDYVLKQRGSLGDGTRPLDMELGPDGYLYIIKASGVLVRIDPETGAVETVASGLGINARGIAIGDAGEIYITGIDGRLIRRNPDGTVDQIWQGSGSLTDVDIGPDGFLYVAGYSLNQILRISPQGAAEVLASGGQLGTPMGLAFGDDGALYVTNRSKYNIVRVEMSGEVSVFADGLAYPPAWLARGHDGGFVYSSDPLNMVSQSTPRGLNYVSADGTVERLHAVNAIGVIDYNGRILGADWHNNTLYDIERVALNTGMLATYRAQMAYAANYYLGVYRDGTGDNIRQATRLMGLAEIRSVVSDPSLLSSIDTAVAYIDTLLRNRQRADGGWGYYTWYPSDPMVTALVGLALEYQEPSADDPVIRSSIQYLLNKQGSDKAWRSNNNILSTKLAATSLVMAYMPKALERLGGIDIDLHLSVPETVGLESASIQPHAAQTDGAGNTEYLWRLTGVTAKTRNVDFDLTLHDMILGEQRKVANSAYLEFVNSFTGERLQLPLEVPTVKASSGLSLVVNVERDTYGADESVDILAHVANTGVAPNSATVELAVRAVGSAEPLVWLDPLEVDTLEPGAARDLPNVWNTGRTFAGGYELYGRLVDGAGRVLNEAVDAFSIVHPTSAATSIIATDKPVYAAWDRVELFGRLRNTASNAILAPTVVEISVFGPQGEQLMFTTDEVGELQPEAYRDLNQFLSLADAVSGTYPVRLTVKDAFSRAVLSQSETAFVVQRTAMQALVGEVNVSPRRVYQGDPTLCTQTLTNRSASDVGDIAVERKLVRIEGEDVVTTRSDTVALPAKSQNQDVSSIATDDLALGTYACVLRAAVGGESAYLGTAGFEVMEPPIRIDAVLSSGDRGRVLILLDGVPPSGTADPHGPKGAPSTEMQRAYLEGLLDEAGWSYTLVETAEAFARELNSGGYAVYALFAEHEKLSEQTQKALREAVHRGEGLLLGGRHDQRNGRLEPALGIEYRGKLAGAQGVSVQESALHPAGGEDFMLADKALRIELAGAEPLGSFSGASKVPADGTAVTAYDYGEGRSVYVGYDLLAEAALGEGDTLHGRLILAGLAHVHPEELEPFAGGVMPLRLVLTNEGIATPGRVLVRLPAGSAVVDASAGAPDPDAAVPTWIWPYSLAEEQTVVLDLWVRLPEDGMAISLEALVQTGIEPEFEDYETVNLLITPQLHTGLGAAIGELAAASDKALKTVLNDLRLAQRQLDAADHEAALAYLLKATDRLMDMPGAEAYSIRLMLDRAIWEVALSIE